MSLLDLTDLAMPYDSIAIIGTAKNAGKTTTLNYMINGLNRKGITLGLTSVGRDGENIDIVTHTPKPEIFVIKGTVLATAERLLSYCDITKQVLHIANISTPFGRVVVVRAMSSGYVQLGGPSITKQIGEIIPIMEREGAQKSLIDGALNRITPADPKIAQAAVLCVGATGANLQKVVEHTQFLVKILSLPQVETLQKNDIFFAGAVSDHVLKKIVLSGEKLNDRRIIAEDSGKFFIQPQTFEKLVAKGATLAVKQATNLLCVTINPTSPYGSGFNPKEFLQKMQEAVNVPVFDVI
ncbi:MAG: hypothetical protein FWG63_03220 [Defluviitaleaceae bacterium]|nr:hypothetical protein [Defluviitaleaceae bacterium]